MTLQPEDEAPRAAGDAPAGAADALTFSFADPTAEVFGLARAALADGTSSGLAVLFAGGHPVAARAEGGVAVDEREWEAIDAAGVTTAVVEPLRAWTVRFDDGEGRGFELEVAAVSHGARLAPDAPAAQAGGMAGYEHLVRVEGVARTGGRTTRLRGLGQRGRLWGAPDWERLALTRSVGVWLGEDGGVTLTAVRPSAASGHDEEAITAAVFDGGPPAVALPVGEPRLSTIADAQGRQRRAGLELWMGDEEGWPRRAAGEVVAGTSLDLGRLRLDCAFFAWRMEGRQGFGRYDVLRRAA